MIIIPLREEVLKNNFETKQPCVYFLEQNPTYETSKISHFKIIKLTVQSLSSTHRIIEAIRNTLVLSALATSTLAIIYLSYRIKVESYHRIGRNVINLLKIFEGLNHSFNPVLTPNNPILAFLFATIVVTALATIVANIAYEIFFIEDLYTSLTGKPIFDFFEKSGVQSTPAFVIGIVTVYAVILPILYELSLKIITHYKANLFVREFKEINFSYPALNRYSGKIISTKSAMADCDLSPSQISNNREGQLIVDPFTLDTISQIDIQSPKNFLVDGCVLPFNSLISFIFRKNLINKMIPHPFYDKPLTSQDHTKLLEDLSALLCIPNKEQILDCWEDVPFQNSENLVANRKKRLLTISPVNLKNYLRV